MFLVGSVVQAMITVADEDYTAPAWHATLLALGACLIAFIGNTWGSKILPFWQNAVFCVHVLAWFAVIIRTGHLLGVVVNRHRYLAEQTHP